MAAGDGMTSGNGKTSPFGPSGGGSASGGRDLVKDPMGKDSGGADLVKDPMSGMDKSGGADMVKNPMTPQKTGVFRNPDSVPAGGPDPFGKGGAMPAPSRTNPKSGFYAGGSPPSGGRKPFKFDK